MPTTVKSIKSGRRLTLARARCAAALWVATSGLLLAQHATIAVNPNSRYFCCPVFDAVMQIQNLTTMPINYEDLQYNYAGDIQDIGALMTPTQKANAPNPKVLIPKGGSFSVDIPVDPATGKLPDALSVSSALNLVIAAAQAAGIVPGTFRVDSSQPGVFFVEPASNHDANGAMAAAQAVFDTPVTVSFQQTIAGQVLDAIFQQVTQKTGFKFTHGSGTVGFDTPMSKVSITASNEPAKYVLARLLAAAYNNGPVGVSYMALFEPQFRYFAFNVQVDAAAYTPPPPQAPQMPPGTGNRLGKKSN